MLRNLGLENPDHTTLFKNEKRYFGGDFGYHVMSEACLILAKNGSLDTYNPCALIMTGVCPEYKAPRIFIDCKDKEALQKNMDEEAERLREFMEVVVFRSVVEDGEEHVAAVDGSGVGISGPGIYFEFIWKVNNRRFIKQHVLINVRTKEVLSFSITMESPGDSAVFAPLLDGAVQAGVKIKVIYADSAYDSVGNWIVTKDNKIEFYPNLKKNFGEKHDLPERNEQKRMEQELGAKEFHRLTGYNVRWLVEVFFSVIKKLYGEKIRNKNFDRMVLTMRTRYELYMIRQRFMVEARRGLAEA